MMGYLVTLTLTVDDTFRNRQCFVLDSGVKESLTKALNHMKIVGLEQNSRFSLTAEQIEVL